MFTKPSTPRPTLTHGRPTDDLSRVVITTDYPDPGPRGPRRGTPRALSNVAARMFRPSVITLLEPSPRGWYKPGTRLARPHDESPGRESECARRGGLDNSSRFPRKLRDGDELDHARFVRIRRYLDPPRERERRGSGWSRVAPRAAGGVSVPAFALVRGYPSHFVEILEVSVPRIRPNSSHYPSLVRGYSSSIRPLSVLVSVPRSPPIRGDETERIGQHGETRNNHTLSGEVIEL